MAPTATSAVAPSQDTQTKKASKQLESILIKQVLLTSGVFKGTEAAGSSITNDLFAEHLANAIAGSGGFGIGTLVQHALSNKASPAPDQAERPNGERSNVTSAFGLRHDPLTGQLSNHTGVDLGAAEGTPIPAAMGGTVISAGPRGGYGNAIEIAHNDGTTTLYAHASALLVAPGDTVEAGATIGLVGQTGRTTGAHLHLEVRQGGHPIDPLKALKSYRLRAEETGGANR
jgi:murein DD-endopeptidase MepM/ murein hydrolase activator NlpD